MTVRANKPAFNIREKLKELTHSIGLKGRELMRAATAQEARDLVSAGRKNLILNGDFRVSQRGDYDTNPVAVANNGYYLDRWKVFLAPGVTTGNIQRLTTNQPPNAPADSYSVRVTATNTTTSDLRLAQPFENPTRFRSQTVTLSAWIKTNSPNCRLYYYAGGSYNSDDFSDPVNGDGQWHYVSFTTTMRSDITNFYPIIGIDGDASASVTVTSGDYFEIAQVQLEFGKNATDFEYRSYGEELALCQRYYVKLDCINAGERIGVGYVNNSTTAQCMVSFPVEMRSNPTSVDTSGTANHYSVANSSISVCTSVPTFSIAGKNSATLEFTVSGGISGSVNDSVMARFNSAPAFFGFSAEL